MSILDNFDGWKEFLGNRVQNAKQSGMGEDSMNHLAEEIGDYLASNVDPKNDEQRLLSDLWNAADENQQHALAGAMINMVQNEK